jgi:hypothetical protein
MLCTYSPSVARVHPRADDRIGTNSDLRHNRTTKMFSFPWTNRIRTRYCASVSNISLNLLFTAWERGRHCFVLVVNMDLVGNNYQPVSFVGDNCVASSPVSIRLSETSANRVVVPVAKSAALGAAKLKTICVAAREVLLRNCASQKRLTAGLTGECTKSSRRTSRLL